MIQHQHWEDSIRILVTDEQHHDSIQAFIPHRTEDKPLDGEADALIYSLWVDEVHRGREVAKHLMEAVEKELKYCGVETVAISWDGRDSPLWVLPWYERLGYEEKALGHQCSTLLKLL
jgi:ribosomal protein S18 acetylase RimI-like enzyme